MLERLFKAKREVGDALGNLIPGTVHNKLILKLFLMIIRLIPGRPGKITL